MCFLCKVSIIVPVYNVAKYIGRCIESVQNQSMSDWELILVDDAGNDDSMRIAKEYASKDTRVKYLESDRNEGPMVAREKGCRVANGDYLFFLDGDDTIPVNALEVLLEGITTKQVDCVKGCINIMDSDGNEKLFQKNELPYGNNIINIYKALFENKLSHNLTGCLFRRNLFKDHKYETVAGMKNGEDAYLFYQLVKNMNNGMAVISDVIYYYQTNETSSTHTSIKDEAIKKMFVTQKYKLGLINKYPELAQSANHTVVRFVTFLALRFGVRKVKGFAEEYDMKNCLTIGSVLKHLNRKDYIDIIKFLICG